MRKLSCGERDEILLDPETKRVADGWGVASSLTDAHGEFGDPRIATTWEKDGRRIEDVRHPHQGSYTPPDRMPCEHWELDPEEDDEDEC